MAKNDLPVSSKQIVYLSLTVFIPLALALVVVFWAPSKPGQMRSDGALAAGIIAVIAIGLLSLIVTTAKRHVIEISRDTLVIRHSLYTLAIERSAVDSAKVREITSMDQVGLSTRKNGIAAFGYFSGWFWGRNGDLTFCALSKWPVYLITFEGSLKCRQLALSTSPEVARSIEAWASPAS
jgi:hypothetical protein